MFSIADRLAEQSNLYGEFSSLRTKLESFLRLAKNVGVQDIAAAAILLKECEDKFDDVMSRTKRELLHTEGYRLKIKRKLNARLAEDDWGDLERKLS
jgi:hypothetical protein